MHNFHLKRNIRGKYLVEKKNDHCNENISNPSTVFLYGKRFIKLAVIEQRKS